MREKDLRISDILTRWYNQNKRDLPWRNTGDPYFIWVSEVILQQTRVDQGYDYYVRFVEKYPTVGSLAKADEEDILKLWQGLGYYSRARNMHAAAKIIEIDHGGCFPINYADVLKLKGIGEYTAAAIVSFAYGQPYAVVDGNVYRVLSRLFAIDTPINTSKGKKEFTELAQALLDDENPGLHNQAIMEFGALQCVPVSPDCEACPLSLLCISYSKGSVRMYPVKEKKLSAKDRFFYYFDIHIGDDLFLKKRNGKDIWQNLFELPLIETEKDCEFSELQSREDFKNMFGSAINAKFRCVMKVKHVLSHQRIFASFYLVSVDEVLLGDLYLRVKREDVEDYPVPRLIHKYLEQND